MNVEQLIQALEQLPLHRPVFFDVEDGFCRPVLEVVESQSVIPGSGEVVAVVIQ